MKIEVYTRGDYKVIRIEQPLSIIPELAELGALIKGYVENGSKHIAVNFFDTSYFYSGAISVLINCYKIIKEQKGTLCIIEPNIKLFELLKQMNIDKIITIYPSEDDLPDKAA